MRILVLGDLPPVAVGGAEVQTLNLARRWAAGGHAVTVVGVKVEPGAVEGFRVVRLPIFRQTRALRGGSYLVAALWLLWRWRGRFDVVYCRFIREHAMAALGARALRIIDAPVVVCPASTGEHGDVACLQRSSLRAVWRWVLQRGGATVNAMSRQIAAEIATLQLRGTRVASIPNGVVLPVDVSLRLETDCSLPWRLVALGRLVDAKGLDVLIAAVGRLRERGHDLQLEIAGDGPLRDELARMVADLGLQACVEFSGLIPPDQVGQMLSRADLFVLSSRYEGMPGVLLQALGHGVPAVSTRVSGAEDVLNDEIGWLVPIEDADALALAIEAALASGRERLREMGARARALMQREYEMDVIAKRYETLFRELVEQSGSSK